VQEAFRPAGDREADAQHHRHPQARAGGEGWRRAFLISRLFNRYLLKI
jgi:hypothetical protein